MSLKTQNLPLITLYLLFNLTVFIVFYLTSTFEFKTFINIFENLSKKDGIVFILLPIIIFIILGIVPQNLKEIIVFWKIENRLPGCYAFSKYAKNDNRINLNLLKDNGISKTHKDFLLAREWTTVTVLFILLSVPSLYFFTNINVDDLFYYFLFLLIEYVLIRFVTKNHAERLVTNVLAYESSRLHQEEHSKKGKNNEHN